MQQTALNLIAIGVFTITLSILLGPLLNISPLIPTITTATILGIATIDTISWQNKGVTLLLDSLSSSQYRQRIIHHEAGHFLAAYLLEIPITGYTLNAWEAFKAGQPGVGGVTFDTEKLQEKADSPIEMRLMLERFATVLMAGIAAEKILYDKPEGGEDDMGKVTEMLLNFGFSQLNAKQKQRWALLQASNLLSQHQESYEALVKAMEKRASVEECFQVISSVQGNKEKK